MRQIYFKKDQSNPYLANKSPKSFRLTQKKRHLKLIVNFAVINLILIIYLLFFSSYFLITRIQIKGLKYIPKNFITKLIKEQENDKRFLLGSQVNLILFNKKEAIEKIGKIVSLENITITKKLPSQLILNIKEKEPALVWIANEKFYYLDKFGTAIREINFFSINPYLPIIKDQKNETPVIGESVIKPEKINFIFALLKKLSTEIKISSLEASNHGIEILTLKSSEGWKAIFDPSQPLDSQLNNLNLIIKNKSADERKKIDYFDLRFLDRIFLKE